MGLQRNILSAGPAVHGLGPKGHKGVGSTTPWKWPQTGVAVLNQAISGLRGGTQELVRDQAAQSPSLKTRGPNRYSVQASDCPWQTKHHLFLSIGCEGHLSAPGLPGGN